MAFSLFSLDNISEIGQEDVEQSLQDIKPMSPLSRDNFNPFSVDESQSFKDVVQLSGKEDQGGQQFSFNKYFTSSVAVKDDCFRLCCK